MNAPTFRIPDPQADRAALLALNVEYLTWVFAEIEQMSGIPASAILGAEVADYVPTVMDKVCGDPPPRGVFYLVEEAGQLLAMGGLRPSEAGIAELKRVYVRPAGRGRGLGATLAHRLVADARRFGYTSVRLDTLPFMHAAQCLYAAMGFIDCPPYPIEMPPAFRSGIRYMQLALHEPEAAAPQRRNMAISEAMPPKLATAALQLDIFEDSREVVLCNALAEAIVRGDLEAAVWGLVTLREDGANRRILEASARLIEHLEEHRRDAIAGRLDATEILRRRQVLNEQVAPAARELFGPANAAPWLATQWRELAGLAMALPWQPDLGAAHPAALYLQASAWELALAAVERIESWRRIPQPLLWMTQARWQLRSSEDIAWPLLAESFWLAPARARALMAGLVDPALDKLARCFEASFEPDGDADWAWLPAWAAVEQPRLAGALASAEAPAHLDAATGLKLVLALLRLERQGRHDDIIGQRKKLRALSQPLFAAYMKTR